MLAACYAATRNLWVPIGLHFGWNFAAGGIFGAVVSGNGEPKGLLDGVDVGPGRCSAAATFGPEGSLYAVLAGVVLTVVFLWLAHRRGHIVPAPPPHGRGPRRPLQSPGDRPPAGSRTCGGAGRRHGPGSPARAAARRRVAGPGAATARVRSSATCRPAPSTRWPSLVVALECLPLAVRRRWPAVCLALVSLGFADRPAPRLPHRRGHRAAHRAAERGRPPGTASPAPTRSSPPRRTCRWRSRSTGSAPARASRGFVTFYLAAGARLGRRGVAAPEPRPPRRNAAGTSPRPPVPRNAPASPASCTTS